MGIYLKVIILEDTFIKVLLRTYYEIFVVDWRILMSIDRLGFRLGFRRLLSVVRGVKWKVTRLPFKGQFQGLRVGDFGR